MDCRCNRFHSPFLQQFFIFHYSVGKFISRQLTVIERGWNKANFLFLNKNEISMEYRNYLVLSIKMKRKQIKYSLLLVSSTGCQQKTPLVENHLVKVYPHYDLDFIFSNKFTFTVEQKLNLQLNSIQIWQYQSRVYKNGHLIQVNQFLAIFFILQ